METEDVYLKNAQACNTNKKHPLLLAVEKLKKLFQGKQGTGTALIFILPAHLPL
jgi:hypothetical protein